jgi:hypothetical protein
MSGKTSSNSKSYRTAAILFSISGLVFIIVGVVSSKIGIYLPIGIAFGILSIGFWQRRKKLIDKEQQNSSK